MARSLLERSQTLHEVGLNPLLTQRQLEAYYGVSDWTVNQWVARGCPVEPTAIRGRRFDLDHVRTWVAENTAQAA